LEALAAPPPILGTTKTYSAVVLANGTDDGFERTSPVGVFPTNGYGVFDMAGNVWEWTTDWFTARHISNTESPCFALGPFGASSASLGVGIYQVTFPSDVSKSVYTATVGDTPAGSPGPGLVVVTPRFSNFDAIFVRTFAPNGASQNNPFHIQVQC
jgi:hypothetical protein